MDGQSLFGLDMCSAIEREQSLVDHVPNIVSVCVGVIRERGLEEDGIFRISGMKSQRDQLKVDFSAGNGADNSFVPPGDMDINSITGVLKDYFRELPEPVLTAALHHKFLAAAAADDIAALALLVAQMPEVHYHTLDMLATLLVEVAALVDTNRMTPTNLGVVFGPTLMAAPVEPGTDPAQAMMAKFDQKSVALQNKCIKLLVEHKSAIFVEGSAEGDGGGGGDGAGADAGASHGGAAKSPSQLSQRPDAVRGFTARTTSFGSVLEDIFNSHDKTGTVRLRRSSAASISVAIQSACY